MKKKEGERNGKMKKRKGYSRLLRLRRKIVHFDKSFFFFAHQIASANLLCTLPLFLRNKFFAARQQLVFWKAAAFSSGLQLQSKELPSFFSRLQKKGKRKKEGTF